MLLSNSENNKQNCDFFAETVAFLYGEMEESQSAKFSLHIENCSNCSKELEAFSAIHTSIQNWKAVKFDVLAAPGIKVPSDFSRKPGKDTLNTNSWLKNLRERFSFGLVPVGVFAALIFCLGLGFWLSSLKYPNEIASNKNENISLQQVSPEVSKAEKSETDNKEAKIKEKLVDSADSKTETSVKSVTMPVKQDIPVKVSAGSKNLKRSGNNSAGIRESNAAKSVKNIPPINNRKAPKLNSLPEEAEDENLRLADLFAEIGAK